MNKTFNKSKGWVTHAAAAEEIPPKYQRDNFTLVSHCSTHFPLYTKQ